jgi:exodeoxyribonuclease VII small subunit
MARRRLTLRAGAFTSRLMGNDEQVMDLSFEDALKRLEEIVHRLESGEESLATAIDLYAEGDRLRAHCEKRLADAQARIEKLTLGSDGRPAGVVAFDAE